MEDKGIVSVIVPVYRVEDYLERCVESIREQTYPYLDVILVDDGSPDACPAMCDRFAGEDERIRVLHKTNGGLSDARNAGIRQATGDWIYFVDSDDFIQKDAIERLLRLALEQKLDVVIGTKRRENNDGSVFLGSGPELYQRMFTGYCWEAWGKLFRRELVADRLFPVGKLFEDLGYVPYAVAAADRGALLDDGHYLYTVREDGIMGRAQTVISPDLVELFDRLIAQTRENQRTLERFTREFAVLFLLGQYGKIKDNMEGVPDNQNFRRAYFRLLRDNGWVAFLPKRLGFRVRGRLFGALVRAFLPGGRADG